MGTFPGTVEPSGASSDTGTGHLAGVPTEDKLGSSKTWTRWEGWQEMEGLEVTRRGGDLIYLVQEPIVLPIHGPQVKNPRGYGISKGLKDS